MVKKLLFILMSIVCIVVSYFAISAILSNQSANINLFMTIFNSLGIYGCITAVFAFAGLVFESNKLLGSRYYIIYNSKIINTIYQLLGVSIFRKVLLFFFWNSTKNRVKYFNGSKEGLQNFIYQTKQSEFSHLGSLLVIIIVSILFMIKGFILFAVATFVFNIFGNFYSIVLQRYHRIRIERIITKHNIK